VCGIAGAWGLSASEGHHAVARMCDDMVARGPDDGGVETFDFGASTSEASHIAVTLGSRRLAIIDPSASGHQPMVDSDRGNAIAFNGMIYNFAELRDRLIAQGEEFVSSCDTEVVLRAYGCYGRDCLHMLRGMFAFAIWDPARCEVFLARDRLGIKPLYYVSTGQSVLFASQVKTLLSSGRVPLRLSPTGTESYLAFASVSDPWTIVDGVLALSAGHSAVIGADGLKIQQWWCPSTETVPALERGDAVRELSRLLGESVDLHLVSDAPLGVFLSGGLDSSLLTALAKERTNHVRTLSVTFAESAYSEDAYMSAVVSRLGTDHTEVRLTAGELLSSAQDAFRAMDQPTYDGINVFTVSRAAARAGLKVALSGLGADELFNGYGFASRIRNLERLRRFVGPAGNLLGGLLPISQASRLVKPHAWLRGELPTGGAYELLRRSFVPSETRHLLRDVPTVALARLACVDAGPDLQRQLSTAELRGYMRDVLLRDCDCMSMSQSLEVRVPFVDHELVEWALRLPADLKDGPPKSLLREVAQHYVPDGVLGRHKQGFVLPLARWMQREMRDRVTESFTNPPSAVTDLVNVQAMRDVWDQFLRQSRPQLAGPNGWLRPWSLFVLCEWVREAEISQSEGGAAHGRPATH
jgi:asparagine synthase (glutamine-hydrolysing)